MILYVSLGLLGLCPVPTTASLLISHVSGNTGRALSIRSRSPSPYMALRRFFPITFPTWPVNDYLAATRAPNTSDLFNRPAESVIELVCESTSQFYPFLCTVQDICWCIVPFSRDSFLVSFQPWVTYTLKSLIQISIYPAFQAALRHSQIRIPPW